MMSHCTKQQSRLRRARRVSLQNIRMSRRVDRWTLRWKPSSRVWHVRKNLARNVSKTFCSQEQDRCEFKGALTINQRIPSYSKWSQILRHLMEALSGHCVHKNWMYRHATEKLRASFFGRDQRGGIKQVLIKMLLKDHPVSKSAPL